MSDDEFRSLEARVDAHGRLIEALAEIAMTMQMRLLALHQVLKANGHLADEEVAGRMAALANAVEFEQEFGEDPARKQWRELRRIVQELEPPHEGPDA